MIEAIKAILPKSSWPWVFSALRQDEVVWNALNDETFIRLAIGRIGRQPSAWTPAALTLISLKVDVNPERLAGDVSAYIPDDLIQKALDFYQEYQQISAESPVDLPQAGLLALAMRAHYQRLNQWNELVAELNAGGCYDAGNPAWQTACACLYYLVPQPLNLLRALLTSLEKGNGNTSDINPFALVTHVILSQPLPIQEQLHIFLELLSSLATTAQLHLLHCIEDQRAQLAEKLAKYLLEQNPYPADLQAKNQASNTLSDQMALLESLNQSIELYQLAKQPESAKRLLSQAETLTKSMQANFMAKTSWAAAQDDDPKTALATWEQVKKTSPDCAGPIQADLAMHLMDKGNFEAAGKVLADRLDCSHPEAETSPSDITATPDYQASLHLARARLSLANNKRSEARDFALQSLDSYTRLLEQKPVEHQGRYCNELQQLATLFLTQGEIIEAARTAELSLASQPDDPEMLFIAAHTQRALGAVSKAVQSAQLAVVLAPERLDLQRELAASLEAAEDWTPALEAWTQVVTSFRDEKGEPQAV
ncbi:MAG: hypothetical protein MUO64_06155, partial [Anaerolineales bacterium]|nr:hypothetical protein [Anaerolineales bacterium]